MRYCIPLNCKCVWWGNHSLRKSVAKSWENVAGILQYSNANFVLFAVGVICVGCTDLFPWGDCIPRSGRFLQGIIYVCGEWRTINCLGPGEAYDSFLLLIILAALFTCHILLLSPSQWYQQGPSNLYGGSVNSISLLKNLVEKHGCFPPHFWWSDVIALIHQNVN